MIYPDGSEHEGVWQQNKKCGIGKFTDKNGSVSFGIWSNDWLFSKKNEEEFESLFNPKLKPKTEGAKSRVVLNDDDPEDEGGDVANLNFN